MDNKYGHKHPTPEIIRLFITIAIAEETSKNIAENTKLTFGIECASIIESAITKACNEFDKHGVYAGLLGEKENG